jgi:lysozyme
MNPVYLDTIRRFEGFSARAQWDYAQNTNGYGTRALYPGEVIDKTEAERRFRSEIADARKIVDRFAPDVDEGTKAALTSLTFNAGTTWTKSGLGEAGRAGDLDTARELFPQYSKAGGETLAGLVARRAAEAAWIGSGMAPGSVVSAAAPTVSATTAAPAVAEASPAPAPASVTAMVSGQAPSFAGPMAPSLPVDSALLARILSSDVANTGRMALLRANEALRLRAEDNDGRRMPPPAVRI